MIRARLSSAAERDILEAQKWYSRQASDLDLAFKDDLDQTLIQVRTHPEAFPIVHTNIRRAILSRFPSAFSMHGGRIMSSSWEWSTIPVIQVAGKGEGEGNRRAGEVAGDS